jgi:hypothetical protein
MQWLSFNDTCYPRRVDVDHVHTVWPSKSNINGAVSFDREINVSR